MFIVQYKILRDVVNYNLRRYEFEAHLLDYKVNIIYEVEGERASNILELVSRDVKLARIISPLYNEVFLGHYEILEDSGFDKLSLTEMSLLINHLVSCDQFVRDVNCYLYKNVVLYYTCYYTSTGFYFDIPGCGNCDCTMNIPLIREISINKKIKDPIKTALRFGNHYMNQIPGRGGVRDIGKSAPISDLITLFRTFDRSKLKNFILGIEKYCPGNGSL